MSFLVNDQLDAQFFSMYLFQFSTCFEQPRAHQQEDQLYWYNWFSWWWARGCLKHVENWNKYIEKNCASSWSFTKNHNKMNGQQNIKTCFDINVVGCGLDGLHSTPRRNIVFCLGHYSARPVLGPIQSSIWWVSAAISSSLNRSKH
jgi:hypothetical protein